MTVGGMLQDQIGTYTDSKSVMQAKLGAASNRMIENLGLDSNITATTPL
jgi:hypothetical protein